MTAIVSLRKLQRQISLPVAHRGDNSDSTPYQLSLITKRQGVSWYMSECCDQQEGVLNKLLKHTANYHSWLDNTNLHVNHHGNVSVIHSFSQCEVYIRTAQVIQTQR